MALDPYFVGLTVLGVAVLGVVLLPRIASKRPLSLPIFYVALGAATFSLPLGLPVPDPMAHGDLAKSLAELGVILALMGAGLKIDRRPGVWRWMSTWRLLAITMPLSIGAAALLGWGVAGFAIPAALLFGAVIAPTDPVLAGEIQVEDPGEGKEDVPLDERAGQQQEVRFALTSEAGLNDSLAFPFTYLAIVVFVEGTAPSDWVRPWLSEYVLFKLLVGLVVGVVLGWLLARLVFAFTVQGRLAESVRGLEALGITLVVYGATELVNGYGFLAVFVAAVMLRGYERDHEYDQTLHDVAEKAEQLLMVIVMVLFGGALVTGLLDPLTLADVAVALALVFVVRPLAGLVGFLGFDRSFREKLLVSFFGVRGLGSFFYLAYGLNEVNFSGAERLWAVVGLVVLVSIVVHGVTATPVLNRFAPGVDEE